MAMQKMEAPHDNEIQSHGTGKWRSCCSMERQKFLLLVHGQVTIIFVVSVCLFVSSFSQPSLTRFRSNLDMCYMSGS